MPPAKPSRSAPRDDAGGPEGSDWQRRVVTRSLRDARQRSIDRGASLIRAAETLLRRSGTDDITVQEVADEAGQSLRTLYQYFESKDDLLLAVFEEAMQTYAELIRSAIRDLDDPLDRLAGAIVAAARMPERSESGFDQGLARLRLRLGGLEPELVARSHLPVSSLFRDLIADAAAAGQIDNCDPEAAAYLITSMNASFIITRTLGNDFGLGLPDVQALSRFCLHGLHADVDTKWVNGVARRIKLPTGSAAKPRARGSKKRSAAAAAAE